ncbi:MAG: hypothetical protein ACOC1G_08860 [Phycisphaeraceae bacterium]
MPSKSKIEIHQVPPIDFERIPKLEPYAVAQDRTEHHRAVGASLASEIGAASMDPVERTDRLVRLTKSQIVDLNGSHGCRARLTERLKQIALLNEDAGGKSAKRLDAAEQAVEQRLPEIDAEIARLQREKVEIQRQQHAAERHSEVVNEARQRVEAALAEGATSVVAFALKALASGDHPYSEGGSK